MKNKDTQNQYEPCILCGMLTEIPLTMPVDCRQYYVEGIGQLCEHCYSELIKR